MSHESSVLVNANCTRRIPLALLILGYSLIIHAEVSNIPALKSCEVGMFDHVLPVMQLGVSRSRVSETQYQAVKNQYNGAASAAAFQIVAQVINTKTDDPVASVRLTAENYNNLARTHWSIFTADEIIEAVLDSCSEVNSLQTSIVDQMRGLGIMDPNVTAEEIVLWRQLIGTAMEAK